jgi:spore coat protein U-like protein
MLKPLSSLCLISIAISSSPAATPITTVQFQVNARIEKGCQLSTAEQTLNFGQVSALRQDTVQSQISNQAQSWNIRCTENLPVNIQLNGGEYFSSTRRMKHLSSNEYIPYKLYQDQTLSTEYPNGKTIALTSPPEQLLNFSIYALADLNNSGQARSAGIFSDRVAITISW